MDFDRSAIRHALAVASWDEFLYHVFVRGDDGEIEHFWPLGAGEGVVFGPERLGGHFDSDPVTFFSQHVDGVFRLHLLGRSGLQLIDWSWPAEAPGWLGRPQVEVLPGYSLRDPIVQATGDGYHVFSVGVEGQLRHWELAQGWFGPDVISGDTVLSPPAAISRTAGQIDVFAVVSGQTLQHWWNAPDGWHTESRGGQNLIGPPTVAALTPNRLDVFCVRSDGIPIHWGWDGLRWFDAEERLSMADSPTSAVLARPEMTLVAAAEDRMYLIGRSTDDKLVDWTFQAGAGWLGANSFAGSHRPFAAWSARHKEVDVLTRDDDGGFTRNFFAHDPGPGMGEPVVGGFDAEGMRLIEPAPPPVTFTPAPVDPDLLLTRPRDLVLLGLRWDGFELRTQPGMPAQLTTPGQGSLTVIFPPQHLAEQVVEADGPVPSGLPSEETSGIPTWRAALSGPSRVVVDVGGPPIPLNVAGVLDALRRGQVRPGEGLTGDTTAIELPYGLVVSPHTDGGGAITCDHPAGEVVSPQQTVGLWQTRISAEEVLVAHPVAADSADPFPLPLSGGYRARILLEEPTARMDRLALSALGGTLSASGAWPGFTWEHSAALGRDRRVRVTVQGVLYPFGHRAEYVELTERVFASTSDGAIALLRKSKTLRITEPVRPEAADPAGRAAFPFGEVELERTYFEGIDSARWQTKDFPTPEVEQLRQISDQLNLEADELYEKLYGDMGPGGGTSPTEDLAAGFTDDGEEPLEEPQDPPDPEARTRAQAAESYLELRAADLLLDQQIAALAFGGVAALPVYFTPEQNSVPIEFPVRLAGRLGDLHVRLPMIFVAEIDRPRGLLANAFNSLTDDEIEQRVGDTFEALLPDGVDVGGTRIDLVRAAETRPADICEVRRLHLVGTSRGGKYQARLGTAPKPGEGATPVAGRWAVKADLPAVRTLLGPDHPPLTLALSRALLDSAPEVDVPFQVPEGFDKLATEFAKNSARSGGICAPDIVADGISRLHGPVAVAGLPPVGGGQLDPKKLLSDRATLLGFKLTDLISAADLKTPPQILSEPQPGLPPKVTLTWKDVKLVTTTGPFVTGDQSTLDLEVVMGAADQRVTCTVQNVALALPDRSESLKLLEVAFGTVVFTQVGDASPKIDVKGIGAGFFGALKLLEDLQKAVDLGGSAPHVGISGNGISASYSLPVPDVTAGAFQMTGMVFQARLDVPFDARPISIGLAFASKEKPFNLSVLMFGGGGYVDVVIEPGGPDGLRRLEIALEFGASLAMNFVVAKGEVHVMGGVRLVKDGEVFAWSGYLRFGGSVSVFGLVTVSVEMTVTLTYRDERLTGRATLVLEIDLTLFSESVELDTGEWELIGGGAQHALGGGLPPLHFRPGDPVPEEWREYREAFAKGSV